MCVFSCFVADYTEVCIVGQVEVAVFIEETTEPSTDKVVVTSSYPQDVIADAF